MTQYAKSGVEGVQLREKTGLWRARVRIGRKRHDVGEFKTIDEAKTARLEFLRKRGVTPRGES